MGDVHGAIVTYKANMNANNPFGYSATAASSSHDHICTCACTRMHAVLSLTIDVCLTVNIARSAATQHTCSKIDGGGVGRPVELSKLVIVH